MQQDNGTETQRYALLKFCHAAHSATMGCSLGRESAFKTKQTLDDQQNSDVTDSLVIQDKQKDPSRSPNQPP